MSSKTGFLQTTEVMHRSVKCSAMKTRTTAAVNTLMLVSLLMVVGVGAARISMNGVPADDPVSNMTGAELLGLDRERLEKNRLALKSLDARSLAELNRQKQRFESLSADEQDRMRKLHYQLENHPQRDKLEVTLQRYVEWLTRLPPTDKASLSDKPPEERIEWINSKRVDQTRQSTVLPPQDAKVLDEWLMAIANEREALIDREIEMLKQKYPDRYRYPSADAAADSRLRFILLMAPQSRTFNPSEVISKSDIEELRKKLSAETASWFSDERLRPLRAIRSALFIEVSDKELLKFYRNGLNEKQRATMDRSSPLNMKRELRVMYIRQRMGMDSPEKPVENRQQTPRGGSE